ncbi:hypothetical protein [Deinococcus cavernae]|uniref:hypothetical protein n=1 Tax=Deinococcus cavernae TaxID=2320857 RepID=UPI0011C20F50|nr:hypothetical protein [Deinococcus cavernae]
MLPDHERQTAQELAQAIQARRPDAEIHALAVHQQGQEGNIHVHVVFGTDTTLRREDLSHFREVAYQMEKNLEERLRVLQLNWQVPLREEVNKEGSRVPGGGTGRHWQGQTQRPRAGAGFERPQAPPPASTGTGRSGPRRRNVSKTLSGRVKFLNH